jgi:hypothetical protein
VAEIPISQDDINELGDKLDSIEGDEERALLSGIVALAAKAIRSEPGGEPIPPQVIHVTHPESPVAVEVEGDLPPIREQIARAFTPGAIAEEPGGGDSFLVRIGHVVSISVDRGPQG